MRGPPAACLVSALSVHVCPPSLAACTHGEDPPLHDAVLQGHRGHMHRQVWHQRALALQGVAVAKPLTLMKPFSRARRPGEGRLVWALPVCAGRQRGAVHRGQLRWGRPPAALGAGAPLARCLAGWPTCSSAEVGRYSVTCHGLRILVVPGWLREKRIEVSLT